MTKPPYLQELKEIIAKTDSGEGRRYFIFGSSVRKDRFHDIDVGVVGNKGAEGTLADLRDSLYDSSIPYPVQVVDFDAADSDFREYVFAHEPLIWIR